MPWDLIIPALGIIIVALITYAGTRFQAGTKQVSDELTNVRAERDALLKEVRELRAKDLESQATMAEQAGRLRDKREILEDAQEMFLWIDAGSKPPAPAISWRVRTWMDKLERVKEQDP